MLNKKNKILLYSALVAIFFGVIIFIFNRNNTKNNENNKDTFSNILKKEKKIIERNSFLVEDDFGVTKKINIDSNEIADPNEVEKEDFSSFENFPKLNIEENSNFQKIGTIFSEDRKKVIASIAVYEKKEDSIEFDNMLYVDDYLCDINDKICEKTDILNNKYEGMDFDLKKDRASFIWNGFNYAEKLIFGYFIDNEVGGVAPFYVCNIEKNICNKTDGYDFFKENSIKAIVPNGSISPSAEKFAVISQNDESNVKTGEKWELFVFDISNINSPTKYDISIAIDKDDAVAYDSVNSVSWNGKEDTIAIGTARKIFLVDLNSGGLSLAYFTPIKDEDFYWNSSSLFFSSDGKYISFIDEDYDNVADDDSEDVSFVNILKKIDLENSNKITQILKGPGLSFY